MGCFKLLLPFLWGGGEVGVFELTISLASILRPIANNDDYSICDINLCSVQNLSLFLHS